MIDATKVFDPKDFESIRLVVEFKNFTTSTEVNPKKAALLEIGERALILDLPKRSGMVGHNVVVTVSQPPDKKNKNPHQLLSVTGKIREIEDVGDDSLRVTVDCVQYDEKSWNALLAIYSSRQDDIEKFFRAVKGT